MVKSGCKIEIAKENIHVFKRIKCIKDHDKWISPVRKTVHELNKVLIACEHLSIKKGMYYDAIHEGFHAYVEEDLGLIPAIIPEGSEYCLGKHGEIVSNQIIVCSPFTEKPEII